MRTGAGNRARTAFVAALALLIPSSAAADSLGPPYVAAGGTGSCSRAADTWMMKCEADGSADPSGAVRLSAFTETASGGALPGTGEALASADIYTEHDRATGSGSLTYTIRLHVDEASVERGGGILGGGKAMIRVWAFATPEDCACGGSAAVTLASSVSGPAGINDQDVAIPVTISGGAEGIPAGTTFIQLFFEAAARISLDTGSSRADATFTVTRIDVS